MIYPLYLFKRGKGKIHRGNDLSAIIYPDGLKVWYKEGIRHRDNDLPAITSEDGHKEWYKEGKFIRAE